MSVGSRTTGQELQWNSRDDGRATPGHSRRWELVVAGGWWGWGLPGDGGTVREKCFHTYSVPKNAAGVWGGRGAALGGTGGVPAVRTRWEVGVGVTCVGLHRWVGSSGSSGSSRSSRSRGRGCGRTRCSCDRLGHGLAGLLDARTGICGHKRCLSQLPNIDLEVKGQSLMIKADPGCRWHRGIKTHFKISEYFTVTVKDHISLSNRWIKDWNGSLSLLQQMLAGPPRPLWDIERRIEAEHTAPEIEKATMSGQHT